MAGPLPFRPFEYMQWAKSVPPGAAYPLHVSGIPAPAALPSAPLLSFDHVLGQPAAAREAFAARLLAYLGLAGWSVLPVTGASEALFAALAATVERGARVLVEQPAYRAAERVAQFLGGVPVRVPREERDGWRLDPERFAAALRSSGARVAAITDPHNPTGASISVEDRAAIIAAVERAGAVLIVDEIFAPFRGSNRPPAWCAHSDRVITAGSLTKGWGLSALRCGWLAGAVGLIGGCEAAYDLLGVNAPAVTLWLAAACFDAAETLDARALACAASMRSAVTETAWGEAGAVPPAAGITAFVRLPAGRSSAEVAARLRAEQDVQTVPGHFFGMDGYLRAGGSAETCDVVEGCRRIAVGINQ